jgi:hypothetical protein
MPFFPRILKHLVGLGNRSRNRSGRRGGLGRQFLEIVPQAKQMHAIAVEFACEPSRRSSLNNAAENQNPLCWRSAGSLQHGAGVGVEHAAAMATTVVDYGCSIPRLHPDSIGPVAAWTTQAARMQQAQEELVARIRIQQIDHWEIHRPPLGSNPFEPRV